MSQSKWKAMAELNTILRCRVGSQAYGLSTEVSDLDEKGVCIEPFETYCTLQGKFEQYEFRTAAERTGKHDAKSESGDLDLTIYSLEKFLRLATYGNPNIVELLFIGGDSILECSAAGVDLRELYPWIVSRQAGRRYLGYMEAQKQRLLGERGQMRVTRTDLINAHGYDTKYASHVLRLGFQGIELLEKGKLTLPLYGVTRDILMDVKAGKYSFDDILNMAGNLETQLKDLVKDGPIRDTPDYDVVEAWMRRAYRDAWDENDVVYGDPESTTVH